MPKQCRFCALLDEGLAPFVMRDEVAAAFLDHRPLFEGHVLVVPVSHVETIEDLPAALVGPFFSRVQALAAAVRAAMSAAGTFVAMNNRVSQSVPHLHVHVVPRNPKDGLRGFFWPRTKYASEAHLAETAARIRAALAPPSPDRE